MGGMGRALLLAVLAMATIFQASAAARMGRDEAKAMVRSFQMQYHLGELTERIGDGEDVGRKLCVIYFILANTSEWHVHRQRGADSNEVLLHSNGHNEAVFDSDGHPVRDGINDASYNFFHPVREPLKHFLMDMHPWLIWGASPRDPTSKEERVRAYIADLEDGLRKALATRVKLRGISDRWDKEGQSQALAFFLSAIEKGGAEELFDLFDDGAGWPSEERIRDILKKLEAGFNRML